MGRTDTFREAMTAARSLHNRIRNHAIVSTFLLTVLVGVLRLHAITRHSRDARLREFFFERCSSPDPFHPLRPKGAGIEVYRKPWNRSNTAVQS